MSSVLQTVTARLEHLNVLRKEFAVYAASLPADLALAGLVDALLDAAKAAVQLCNANAPVVAFPLARIVFEAAQRVIVLATADDYVRVGTRAWLYYQRKDMRLARFARGPEAAREWLENATRQLPHIWSAYNPQAEAVLRDENERLNTIEKKHQPDNFMGEDLGEVVESRYVKLITASGQSLSELRNLNRAIYTALSRESHARICVDPAGLQIDSEGIVRVIPRKIDESVKQNNVLGCLDSSLAEAGAALGYLARERERQRRDRIQAAVNDLAKEPVSPTFKPDLGLHLVRSGGAATTFHFPNALAQKLGILSNGTVTWSVETTFGDREFLVTFDVPQPLVAELAGALGIEARDLRPVGHVRKHVLAKPTSILLECRLGEIQKAASESFVPLVAIRVAPGSSAPGN